MNLHVQDKKKIFQDILKLLTHNWNGKLVDMEASIKGNKH